MPADGVADALFDAADTTIEATDATFEATDATPDAAPEVASGPRRLKLMTFNLRLAFGDDGPLDTWEQRRDRAAAIIAQEAPDVLGTQEGWVFQLDDLLARVDGYEYAGISRTGSDVDEYSAVFWRTDRFDREADGTFWLSPTPDVPSSVFSENQLCTRIATWVRLAPRDGGPAFTFMNTHVDTKSVDDIQLKSAALLARKLDELAPAGPAFLTGDFNAAPDSPPYRVLTGAEAFDGTAGDLVDSWRELGQAESGTFHGFTGTATGARIDWILHRPGPVTVDATIVTTAVDGRYPSDHFPVTATVEIP
jgi:endonuclease/exonuclease/phosphatase family metal-dependent hydrolase